MAMGGILCTCRGRLYELHWTLRSTRPFTSLEIINGAVTFMWMEKDYSTQTSWRVQWLYPGLLLLSLSAWSCAAVMLVTVITCLTKYKQFEATLVIIWGVLTFCYTNSHHFRGIWNLTIFVNSANTKSHCWFHPLCVYFSKYSINH